MTPRPSRLIGVRAYQSTKETFRAQASAAMLRDMMLSEDDAETTCCLCRKSIASADEKHTLPATTVVVHRACWDRELVAATRVEHTTH